MNKKGAGSPKEGMMGLRVTIELVLDYMCNYKDLINSLSSYTTIEFNETFLKSQIESIEDIHTIF